MLLGQILLDGRGIQQDATVARRWFGIAAQSGSAMAHNMLGRCLEHGWGGEVSLAQAAVHYARAADSGLDWGLYNLGNLLATGRGVPANQVQALMCYEGCAAGACQIDEPVWALPGAGHCHGTQPGAGGALVSAFGRGGDFRGMFSLALVLVERGQLAEAGQWLEQARVAGNMNFCVLRW